MHCKDFSKCLLLGFFFLTQIFSTALGRDLCDKTLEPIVYEATAYIMR